jgi:hypothetical protein
MTVAVTPVPGLTSVVTNGGTPVEVIPGAPNGGFITNPISATDQGLGAPENLYVDPVNPAGLVGNGTTFVLYPGASWPIIPGQTSITSVNAASNGHKFSVVWF